ncbi:MAG TPA: AAA family ATPase [Roseateles sp.]|uniref:ATP-binding protein n=1 Tax=Roseateles sp. TaxID=1971397 RepID=UPI002ED8AB3C
MHLLLSRTASVQSTRHADGATWALADLDAALLAWLALEGPTQRTRLSGLLWPASDPVAARNSLRQRLFKLKRQCGAELVVGGAVLKLAEGVSHDLHDADDVLGATPHDHSPEFAAWLRHQRARRRRRLRQALVERCERAEQARDYADALLAAQELLALEPLSEDAHRRVMRLHYLAGDRAAALLAFDRCERMLKDEVAATPDDQTLQLLRAIEQPAADAALRPATAVPAAVLRPPRLFGRAEALGVLGAAVAQRTVVLLSGEAGMGKSRLVAALAEASPAAVLGVAARVGDDMAPFALAARWLRALLRWPGVAATDAQRLALANVLPEFGPVPARTPAADRALQVEAIEGLLATAAAQGLCACAVDDLQFADAASVQLLHALAGCSACGWVLAMRPDGLGAAQQALLKAHRDASHATELHLQPLADDEVQALIDSLGLPGLGGPAQARALRRHTGGNPLYLLETVQAALTSHRGELTLPGSAMVQQPGERGAAIAWPQADSVLRLIQQRLARLSPMAMKLTRCAAIAGQDLSAALAAEVLGLRTLDLTDAWAELEAAQVLREGGFAHDLIAEAARGSVPQAIACTLHGEVAAFLEQHQGEPARVAEHWTLAGEALRAVPHLTAAAQRARAAGQFLDAARLHERAAVALRAAGQRSAALEAFFAAADILGDASCAQDLERLLESLDELAGDDDADCALVACVRIVLLSEQGRHEDAVRLALDALGRAERSGQFDLQAELHWDLAALRWMRREMADAARHAEQALHCLNQAAAAPSRLEQVGRSLAAIRRRVLNASALLLTAAGRHAQADARFEEGWALAQADRDSTTARNISAGLAANALDQGRLDRALVWSERAVVHDERLDADLSTRLVSLTNRTAVLAVAGDLGGALALTARVAEICAQGTAKSIPAAWRRVHWLQHELGRGDLARKGLQALLERPDLLPIDRTAIEATLLHAGGRTRSDDLLDRIVALDDFPMRARLLSLAQSGCDAQQILPLLSASAATARDCGARGLWRDLQAARVAALRSTGRRDEAAQAALSLWPSLDEGLAGLGLFSRLAAEVAAALGDSHAELAATIRLRVSAWRAKAASTLPEPWRQNYLSRAPGVLPTKPSSTPDLSLDR